MAVCVDVVFHSSAFDLLYRLNRASPIEPIWSKWEKFTWTNDQDWCGWALPWLRHHRTQYRFHIAQHSSIEIDEEWKWVSWLRFARSFQNGNKCRSHYWLASVAHGPFSQLILVAWCALLGVTHVRQSPSFEGDAEYCWKNEKNFRNFVISRCPHHLGMLRLLVAINLWMESITKSEKSTTQKRTRQWLLVRAAEMTATTKLNVNAFFHGHSEWWWWMTWMGVCLCTRDFFCVFSKTGENERKRTRTNANRE